MPTIFTSNLTPEVLERLRKAMEDQLKHAGEELRRSGRDDYRAVFGWDVGSQDATSAAFIKDAAGHYHAMGLDYQDWEELHSQAQRMQDRQDEANNPGLLIARPQQIGGKTVWRT